MFLTKDIFFVKKKPGLLPHVILEQGGVREEEGGIATFFPHTFTFYLENLFQVCIFNIRLGFEKQLSALKNVIQI